MSDCPHCPVCELGKVKAERDRLRHDLAAAEEAATDGCAELAAARAALARLEALCAGAVRAQGGSRARRVDGSPWPATLAVEDVRRVAALDVRPLTAVEVCWEAGHRIRKVAGEWCCDECPPERVARVK